MYIESNDTEEISDVPRQAQSAQLSYAHANSA